MTPQEFKAWFEGYTEALSRIPSKKQWERIKEMVGQIDGTPVTPVYLYKYWPNWYTSTYTIPYTIPCSTLTVGTLLGDDRGSACSNKYASNSMKFNLSSSGGVTHTACVSASEQKTEGLISYKDADTVSIMRTLGQNEAKAA